MAKPLISTTQLFLERYEHEHGPEGLAEVQAEIRRLQRERTERGESPDKAVCRRKACSKFGMKGWHEERDLRLQVLEEQKAAVLKLMSRLDIDRYAAMYVESERLFRESEDKRITAAFRKAWRKVEPEQDVFEEAARLEAEEAKRLAETQKRKRIYLWRKAVTALPATGAPNEKDLEWVYHLLPLLIGPEYERDDNGVIILSRKYIKDAPSRGAVMMLLNALEDPKDFTKAVIEVVKSKSKKDERKPDTPDRPLELDTKEQDPGLEGLITMQKKMGGGS